MLPSSPTFALLLGHDGVAEREQAEELVHVGIPQLDGFQQAGVPELEPWIRQRVKGEINRLWPLAGGEDRVTAVTHGHQHRRHRP